MEIILNDQNIFFCCCCLPNVNRKIVKIKLGEKKIRTTFQRSLTTCPGWSRSSVAMVMCPLVCLAGRATHGSCRRFGLLGLRVSTKLAALWLFWLFCSSLLWSASSSLLLDELLLLLCKRTAEVVEVATAGRRPARTQPLLLDCEKPLTRRENAEILMPPSPVAETATDLTDDTVASSAASAATSKQGLGSAELATTRKHKKCEGKPIKAGHTPQTGGCRRDSYYWRFCVGGKRNTWDNGALSRRTTVLYRETVKTLGNQLRLIYKCYHHNKQLCYLQSVVARIFWGKRDESKKDAFLLLANAIQNYKSIRKVQKNEGEEVGWGHKNQEEYDERQGAAPRDIFRSRSSASTNNHDKRENETFMFAAAQRAYSQQHARTHASKHTQFELDRVLLV